jgi:Flp pilus assembly protein TadD
MEYLNKASAISPADPRPLVSAGLLSKESKDYSQAEKYLRRAASLAPKDINIQRQLAQVIALALIHQPLHEKV